jgi:hypothetical protein
MTVNREHTFGERDRQRGGEKNGVLSITVGWIKYRWNTPRIERRVKGFAPRVLGGSKFSGALAAAVPSPPALIGVLDR